MPLVRPDPQVSEQVWFPGVHCNVGGGYVDAGLSNISIEMDDGKSCKHRA